MREIAEIADTRATDFPLHTPVAWTSIGIGIVNETWIGIVVGWPDHDPRFVKVLILSPRWAAEFYRLRGGELQRTSILKRATPEEWAGCYVTIGGGDGGPNDA